MSKAQECLIMEFSPELMQWCLWVRVVSEDINFALETYYNEVEKNPEKILEMKIVEKKNQWWY